ncbi:DUF368 domain-containing protein [Tenuifilum sp.]|uniref:DUF368 domain-containing protein n=1 Tax=Tenuifilum sp. TaxID=2760880 RepID=UPI001B615DA8|nr:DUF368 domain-containing protein [Bacteroidales bacterium]HOK60835.1 DUF368 domain-containing protein [Tenuifilum sp.]HOK85593.1 DUF368 domain-containing protein [Tenuifilum sp.]HON70364.1 DUF368 domain-containing protein [Tenuifilum sp.]HOU74351.1 DUF368 domain-containing protein [Tenuifilum sp.]
MIKRGIKDYILLVLKGIGMGAADVIPGVSGGTIAFITGIYEELIDSIKSVVAPESLKYLKSFSLLSYLKAINADFLLAVIGGIAISFLSLAKLMQYLLTNHPIFIWSFFFGLILASVWFVAKIIEKWNVSTYLFFITGIILGFAITTITPTETPNDLWFIFICGVVAICAMILPGISGSFILLLMGKYIYMMSALSSFNFPIILVFLLGAAVGILAFSNFLSWLLHHFHAATIAVLAGFMLGSLNKVWPWKVATQTFIDAQGIIRPLIEKNVLPSTYLIENKAEPYLLGAIGFAILGAIIIILFERFFSKPVTKEVDLREKLGL